MLMHVLTMVLVLAQQLMLATWHQIDAYTNSPSKHITQLHTPARNNTHGGSGDAYIAHAGRPDARTPRAKSCTGACAAYVQSSSIVIDCIRQCRHRDRRHQS